MRLKRLPEACFLLMPSFEMTKRALPYKNRFFYKFIFFVFIWKTIIIYYLLDIIKWR